MACLTCRLRASRRLRLASRIERRRRARRYIRPDKVACTCGRPPCRRAPPNNAEATNAAVASGMAGGREVCVLEAAAQRQNSLRPTAAAGDPGNSRCPRPRHVRSTPPTPGRDRRLDDRCLRRPPTDARLGRVRGVRPASRRTPAFVWDCDRPSLAGGRARVSSKARVADSEERALASLRMQALSAWALTEAPPHHCPGGFRPCPACLAAPGVVLAYWSRTGPRIRREKPRRPRPNAGSRDVRVRCILGGTTGAGLASRRVQRSPPIGPGSSDL
jgi:hypothetical protein